MTRRATRRLAQCVASTAPGRYTLSAAPTARRGRIFLDYLRNGRGNTAVGAWSPRARKGFPIAVPVTWKQVEAGVGPTTFLIDSPPRARRPAS
jgi:bifunctional non-homologous end joining protein LigD